MQRLKTGILYALASIGLLHVVVTVTPLVKWWTAALMAPWEDPTGEVVIVPGAETNGDTIGISSYWRCIYAVRAWRQGGVRHIVVSGGGAIGSQMREFLIGSGVPAAAILTEDRSASTRENALFSKALVDPLPGRKILITSDYHSARATAVFRKAGIAVEPRPIPDALKRYGQPGNRWAVFWTLALETVKTGYYRWKGWT